MIENLGVFKDNTDGTLKSVFRINNRNIVEMSLLFNKEDKDVVCVPTHHFCNLGCKMCHLTNKGLNKSMIPIKSDDFIKCLVASLTCNGIKRTRKKKLLISFMGVGEPLLNLKLIEEVYKAEEYLKEVLGYESVGYALATMMPNDNILKLKDLVMATNMPLKVHFSLHTPVNVARKELIPSTNVSVEEALAYLLMYRKSLQNNMELIAKYKKLHTTDDPIEIHYTLIKGVNDGEAELGKMCELLKNYNIPIKFIRFNPTSDLKRSENEERWVTTIGEEIPDLRIKTYSPPGREVGSSCGEFTKHYYHEEIETEEQKHEFENWKKKHLVLE